MKNKKRIIENTNLIIYILSQDILKYIMEQWKQKTLNNLNFSKISKIKIHNLNSLFEKQLNNKK